QAVGVARAFRGGSRADHPRVDRTAAVWLARPLLRVPRHFDLAATGAATAPTHLYVGVEPGVRRVRGAQRTEARVRCDHATAGQQGGLLLPRPGLGTWLGALARRHPLPLDGARGGYGRAGDGGPHGNRRWRRSGGV